MTGKSKIDQIKKQRAKREKEQAIYHKHANERSESRAVNNRNIAINKMAYFDFGGAFAELYQQLPQSLRIEADEILLKARYDTCYQLEKIIMKKRIITMNP